MTDEKKPSDPKPVTEDKAASDHKITRRRFTKAGAVAPVIMTLGSRPVWGQTCSFSGALSGNDYATAKPIAGIAHPPAWWLTDAGQTAWPIKPGNPNSDKVLDSVGPTFTCVRSFFTEIDKFVTVLGGGCVSLKANVAAAILDILAGQYYYDMADLNAFLCSASDADARKVLQCLNNCVVGV
jgi:hypothetical protein